MNARDNFAFAWVFARRHSNMAVIEAMLGLQYAEAASLALKARTLNTLDPLVLARYLRSQTPKGVPFNPCCRSRSLRQPPSRLP